MNYDEIIFDLDGTLIQSSNEDVEWLYQAVREALETCDHEASAGNLSGRRLGKLAGLDGFHDYLRVCQDVGADPRVLWNHVSHFRAKAKLGQVKKGNLDEQDGATALLDQLKNDFRLGLVSNGPDESVKEVSEYFEWDRRFQYIRGVTDLKDLAHRKPDPYHLQIAKEFLEGSSGLYVGNEVVDVKAAEEAGFDSVILGLGRREHATYAVTGLEELRDIVSGK